MPDYISELLVRMPALLPLADTLEMAVATLCATYRRGGKIMTCGNGGSAADAEHIVGELMKGFRLARKLPEEETRRLLQGGCPEALVRLLQRPVPAVSLVAGISLPTAFANDVSAKAVFAQEVLGLGRAEDTLLAISTSGNSENVLMAVQVASALGIGTIALTGKKPGHIGRTARIAICAPASSTPLIQEYHVAIYHAICSELEDRLFGLPAGWQTAPNERKNHVFSAK